MIIANLTLVATRYFDCISMISRFHNIIFLKCYRFLYFTKASPLKRDVFGNPKCMCKIKSEIVHRYVLVLHLSRDFGMILFVSAISGSICTMFYGRKSTCCAHVIILDFQKI